MENIYTAGSPIEGIEVKIFTQKYDKHSNRQLKKLRVHSSHVPHFQKQANEEIPVHAQCMDFHFLPSVRRQEIQ